MPAVIGVVGGPFTIGGYAGAVNPGMGLHGAVHMMTTRSLGDCAIKQQEPTVVPKHRRGPHKGTTSVSKAGSAGFKPRVLKHQPPFPKPQDADDIFFFYIGGHTKNYLDNIRALTKSMHFATLPLTEDFMTWAAAEEPHPANKCSKGTG